MSDQERPLEKREEQGEDRLTRRRALLALGAVGSITVLGCSSSGSAQDGGSDGPGGGSGGSGGGGTAGTDATAGSCNEIPDETPGPYPDTMGMIGNQTFYRSDITEGKTGTPLTLNLTVVDANGCAAIANAHIEIWHCDAGGVYSEYSNTMNAGSTLTTYLRGVQTTDSAGKVTFKTIYPGWYSPRATHIHIQVFNGTTLKKTTQIGMPDSVNVAVYGNATLYQKGQNTTTNDTDQVFGNAAGTGTDGGGHTYQIATVTGSNAAGYGAEIVVGIKSYA